MTTVPADLLAAAQKDFAALGKNSVVGDVDTYLAAFVGATPYIAIDERPLDNRSSPFEMTVLTPYVAWKVASLVPWLFVNRPVGDPVRAGIPKIVAALRKVLADNANVWHLESKYYDEEKPPKRAKRHEAMVALVGGKPVMPANAGAAWVEGRDDGTLILAPSAPLAKGRESSVHGGFYTAKLDDSSLARIVAYAKAISDWPASEIIPTAQYVLSDGFAALGARVAKTPVATGGWEPNPAASAPATVAKVASTLRVSNEAAALYLQTMALPAPTKANVLAWNGWTSQQYDEAAAALVKTERVVEAKVDGAGRKLFAPGGIVKKTKLNLPIESSKLPFTTHGRYVKHLITEPCHILFERVES